jgi:hypothetical protein
MNVVRPARVPLCSNYPAAFGLDPPGHSCAKADVVKEPARNAMKTRVEILRIRHSPPCASVGLYEVSLGRAGKPYAMPPSVYSRVTS